MDAIPKYMIKGTEFIFGDSQAPMTGAIYRGKLAAATTNAAGGVLTLQNTTGYDMYVEQCLVDVTTKSTGAATLAAGTAATVASSNNLLDATDVGTAAIIASNLVGGGTAGKIARWVNGKYLTITASADSTGMVGTYLVKATPC